MEHGACTPSCIADHETHTARPGPWQVEPHRVEFEHAGFNCLLHRGGLGAWCGYVGVPQSHPAHGIDYYVSEYDREAPLPDTQKSVNAIEVHGGLTYAEECHGPICHVPNGGEDETLWWFGFDCAHSGDVCPGMDREFSGHDRYRDVDYVRRETERLAEQLAEIC